MRRGTRGALAAFLAVALAAGSAWAQATEVRGTVVEPQGTVEHYVAAFHKWKGPLRGDARIYVGDRVRTGSGSTCKVVFRNRQGKQDTIAVGADTLLEVPDIPENQGQVSWIGMFSEAVGKIFCAVTRRPPGEGEDSPFVVRTPTVVAGVRGTEFDVEYQREDNRTILGVRKGVIDAARYTGLALGLLSSNQELAIDALKVYRYLTHLRNAQRFFKGANEIAAEKANLDFHIAEYHGDNLWVDDQAVTPEEWAHRELPWDGPGRSWENPMVVRTGKFPAILHLRNTGWFELDDETELSCYRLGNAFLARLRRGKLTFYRVDPSFKPLSEGPKHDVEIFMARGDDADLKVLDYTPKGGVTKVTLEMAARGLIPSIDVAEGEVKVIDLVYED